MPSPILLSTWSFGQTANASAWPDLVAGGPALDAAESVCRHAEEDAEVDSVGYGGLPDRDGRVTLDASVMLSPSQCGAVCAMSYYSPAVSVARVVMEKTRHVLVAGPGAEALAAEHGFRARDLLAPSARKRWQERLDRNPRVETNTEGGHDYEWPDEDPGHDTIGALALDASGTLAGACTTSGLSFKRRGRVGDSPIIGHGIFVEPGVGAAVATGLGELAMGVCASFLAVETLRAGGTPEDAAKLPLERIARQFELDPKHQLAVLALSPDGEWSSAALRPGYVTALRTKDDDRRVDPATVIFDERSAVE